MILDSPDYLAPAKLNLFLHILGRRTDGYHSIQTLFQLLNYGDVLRFQVRQDGVINRVNPLPGVSIEADLTVRAARALQLAGNVKLGVDIELDKHLPMGGGVGGGSSDAATVLMVLNHLWGIHLPRQQLIHIGLSLGADVPVFIYGRSSIAEGIGERLQIVDLPPVWYVVLTPAVNVSTKEIFADSELTRDTKPITFTGFSGGQIVFEVGHNDLQPVAVKRYPEIGRYIAWLNQFGDARMTGSGASIFCAFADESSAIAVLKKLPSDMNGFVAAGCNYHPLFEMVDD